MPKIELHDERVMVANEIVFAVCTRLPTAESVATSIALALGRVVAETGIELEHAIAIVRNAARWPTDFSQSQVSAAIYAAQKRLCTPQEDRS